MGLMSKNGISIVELTVFIAAATIVGAAVVSVQFNIKRGEKKIQVINTLLEKKRQFDEVLKEKETFIKTVKNLENLSMICVRNELSCPAEHVANKYRPDLSRIALYNQHGNLFYDGRGTNSKGFTDTGAECEGFTYGGAGNDNCPIGYIVNWHVAKQDLTDENSLSISAKLVYNPSDNNPQKTIINNLIAGADLSPYDSSGSMSLAPNQSNKVSPSCTVGAVTLYNGGVYTFYESAAANLGALCKSEIRICTIVNDTPTISGSFTSGTCVQNCYGEWSSCSASCGGGTRTFNKLVERNNYGASCGFDHGEVQACNSQPCPAIVDCQGSWGSCSASCGGGTQDFTITTPAANGGLACPTPTTRPCNEFSCASPINCQGSWGACSASCDGGMQSYNITTVPANGGTACPSPITRSCNEFSCSSPINCQGSWGTCSATCGGGSQEFNVTTAPANGGTACPTPSIRTCNSQACDIDCQGYWSTCSDTCGGGTQNYIITVAQSGSGLACPTSPQTCNTQSCSEPPQPVNCEGTWGSCSATCGGGTQNFTVTTPAANGGTACPTSPRSCNETACPVDCQGSWGSCSASCGGGTETFTITTPAANGGVACPAPTTRDCNTTPCVPAGSCTTRHPIGWSGGSGFNPVHCAEYFRAASSTAPFETRTISDGETAIGRAGYCFPTSCHGETSWRCENGNVIWLGSTCKSGQEP
jgi:hypothetical protein